MWKVLFGTDNSKEYEAIEQQMMDNIDKVCVYIYSSPLEYKHPDNRNPINLSSSGSSF